MQCGTVPKGEGLSSPTGLFTREESVRNATADNPLQTHAHTPSFHVKTQLRDTCATRSCGTAHDVHNKQSQVRKTELVSA